MRKPLLTLAACTLASSPAPSAGPPRDPSATIEPPSITAAAAQDLLLTLIVSPPDTNITAYQWRKDGEPISDGGPYIGTATDTLLIIAACSTDSGVYTAAITTARGDEFISDGAPVSVAFTGDLNLDGAVSSADLNILLADFGCSAPSGAGAPPAARCPADLDHDADTDTDDLNLLLGAFGASCN